MTLPQNSRFDLTSGLPICRILNGMWQVSGAHGAIDPDAAISSMFDYVDAGFTTWDLADHYGPAEDFVGEFRRRLASARGGEAVSGIQAFTKWVPRPGPMTRQVVENNIDISRRRMGMDRLDLLQFHWWDYQDSTYLEALTHLSDLWDEGKIQELALTNFDTQRMQEIAGQGIRVVSNQVQYSLVDRRPEVAMVGFCQSNEVSLLAYGTLCGGLLSDRYLGRPTCSVPLASTRHRRNRRLASASVALLLTKVSEKPDRWSSRSVLLPTIERNLSTPEGTTTLPITRRWYCVQSPQAYQIGRNREPPRRDSSYPF